MSIKFFYNDVKYRLRRTLNLKELFIKIISINGYRLDNLIIVLVNDNYLLEINKEFKGHDYFTDIIAFDYTSDLGLKGEIYISIDTVKRNAKNYGVTFKQEILRVMIHGILHLSGYNDITDEEKIDMRNMEDFWIQEYYMNYDRK